MLDCQAWSRRCSLFTLEKHHTISLQETRVPQTLAFRTCATLWVVSPGVSLGSTLQSQGGERREDRP